jgi:hypothetical protein
MMHVKFYAISILFLIAVGACFLLIAMGYGPNRGIAADNEQPAAVSPGALSILDLDGAILSIGIWESVYQSGTNSHRGEILLPPKGLRAGSCLVDFGIE